MTSIQCPCKHTIFIYDSLLNQEHFNQVNQQLPFFYDVGKFNIEYIKKTQQQGNHADDKLINIVNNASHIITYKNIMLTIPMHIMMCIQGKWGDVYLLFEILPPNLKND